MQQATCMVLVLQHAWHGGGAHFVCHRAAQQAPTERPGLATTGGGGGKGDADAQKGGVRRASSSSSEGACAACILRCAVLLLAAPRGCSTACTTADNSWQAAHGGMRVGKDGSLQQQTAASLARSPIGPCLPYGYGGGPMIMSAL